MSVLPAEEILASLEVSPQKPSRSFLEQLLFRFNASVPFESISKNLAGETVRPADLGAGESLALRFWRDFLERGSGGTCFARVAAFRSLLRETGFATTVLLGRVEKQGDHAALLVSLAEGSFLADVGFPVPALLPLPESQVPSPLGPVSVGRAGPGQFVVDFEEGPWSPRQIRIFDRAVEESEFLSAWRKTFQPGSPLLGRAVLVKIEERRALRYEKGEIWIDDAYSRTRLPLSGNRAARLSELFGIDRELLVEGLDRLGDAEPAPQSAEVEAYLDISEEPDRAFALIAEAGGYSRLVSGLGEAEVTEQGESRFRIRIAAPGVVPVEELVAADSATRTLTITREPAGSLLRTSYRAEPHEGGGTRLIRLGVFDSPREDLLRSDSSRSRLAAVLLMDLLAWKRLGE